MVHGKRRPHRGTQGSLLHHDNASAHTAAATLHSMSVATHPPYSPDLAPCDCDWPCDRFLFQFLKKLLRGIKFQNPEDARAHFEGVIFTLPRSTWSGVMDRWFERMNKCVNAEGGFIEKLDWSTCRSVFCESFRCELIEPPLVDL